MESPEARRRRARRARHGPSSLIAPAVVAVAVAGATAGGTAYVRARAHPGAGAVSSAATPSASSPPAAAGEEASVEPATSPSAVARKASLSRAMASVTVPSGAELSAAVFDLASGDSAVYGGGAFDTASIVKVDVLAALLLQAQDAGRHLTDAERVYATRMIENSDNASTTALWHTIGRAEGLDAANRRFGLGSTSGGAGGLWGLTQTTASDQLRLLRQVFTTDSRLSAASRAYVRGLMESVEPDQRWGVSAAAPGSAPALKNGWLPRSTSGLWDVNSIGRVRVDGTGYLVAVLSKGTAGKARGISLVEAAAKAAVSGFAAAS
ncbi:serine hydrolase [Streptomyces sp. IBSBF 3136]|uniref:serine hydrolase n=1 Tax=Streptomyces sp. IBSBF 3136 TaxID=2903524 RepID=UPI002FDBC212